MASESRKRPHAQKAAQTSDPGSIPKRTTSDSFDLDSILKNLREIGASLDDTIEDSSESTSKPQIDPIPSKQQEKITKRLNELRHSKADLKHAKTYLPNLALYCRDCGVSRDAIRKGTASNTSCMVHPPIARYGSGECRGCHKMLNASPSPPPCTPASQFHRFIDDSEDAMEFSKLSFRHHNIIVLACKTVGKKVFGDALVHLTAVDFMTGVVLIDMPILVLEVDDVVDWRTEETGVSAASMAESGSMEYSNAKPGWLRARDALVGLADCNTLFVGFAVQQTLTHLRLKTDRIVDFQILYGKRFKKQVINLHQACQTFLKRTIRKGGKRKSFSTCLEDAVAARELLMHWIDVDGNVRRVNLSSEEEREMNAILAEEDERFAKAERSASFGGRSAWFSDIDPHDEEEAEEDWKINRRMDNRPVHWDRGRYAGGF